MLLWYGLTFKIALSRLANIDYRKLVSVKQIFRDAARSERPTETVLESVSL